MTSKPRRDRQRENVRPSPEHPRRRARGARRVRGLPARPRSGAPTPSICWRRPPGTIGRASLHATGVDQSFITGGGSPDAVSVDAGHVYWANLRMPRRDRSRQPRRNRRRAEFITGPRDYLPGRRVYAQDIYRTTIGRPLDQRAIRQSRATSAIGRANLDGRGGGRRRRELHHRCRLVRPPSRSTPATSTGPALRRDRSAAPTSTARASIRPSSPLSSGPVGFSACCYRGRREAPLWAN